MSNVFAEREKAFEDKWAHDEELRFKVLARRNRLLGLWAAGEMGLVGAAAETYAKTVVQADVVKGDDSAVLKQDPRGLQGREDRAHGAPDPPPHG